VQLEIVIVNDGGVELPRSVLDHFASFHQPITVVRHHRNLGLGASRNTGATIAKGAWLMMLDDDDTLVDESVGRLLDAAHANERAAFIFGDHLRQVYEGHIPTAQRSMVRIDQRLEELHIENPIMCGSFLITRESFAALRGYREDLPVHEDYNLHVRALASIRWAYVGVPICVYHCRGAIPRLNHRRLYWFATSAFNHAVFRSLFGRTNDHALIRSQRENQYAHLSRALDEGCPLELARSLVQRWWESLASRGLSSEVSMDELILSTVWPALLRP
jgi:glycosyltransferase involved in cell wall biosynthesis